METIDIDGQPVWRPVDESPLVLDQWAATFERSPLRLHREFDARTYVGLVAPLCDALATALHAAADGGAAALAPGQPGTRDLEQGCGFVGARLATSGAVGGGSARDGPGRGARAGHRVPCGHG